MAKIVCVLCDDPIEGYPTGAPGLRKYLEDNGHQLVIAPDKDGPDSVFERELADAEVVISQPFWPAYLTAERIANAPKLKLAITAGVGSDHVDLQAAIERNITVAEVTFSNSISVPEHVVMMVLGQARNHIPSYQWVVDGGWSIADRVSRAYDVEGMYVGTVEAGRIGLAVLPRLKHISGTTISAQDRYAAGTREILECWFEGRPIREEYLIVDGGELGSTGAKSCSAGDSTGSAEQAARFTSAA